MINKSRDADLLDEGEWFEKSAELAEMCNYQEIAKIEYRRAIETYEQGGWIEAALKVARKLQDQRKIEELEAKIK